MVILKNLKNIFAIKELRNRILFTLGILIVIPIIHRNVPALLVRFGFTDDPELGYTLRSLLIKVLAMYMTIFYPVRNEIKI